MNPAADSAVPPLPGLQMLELVRPTDANHYGTLFGPQALALLGKAAYLAAAQHSAQPVVMASAQRIDFLRPVPVGALLEIDARITRLGRSSLSVEVRGATPAGPALRASFEMVAVDEHGRPTPLRSALAA